ncbi:MULTISPECIES: hypothetical protein [Streptomyces]|uniref:Uncharacterized protein n=2 Tax=Streptomyces TaxID=1883 RepID=A0A646KMD9_STRJU|nr:MULTISPECIES: hypothetical protein [Streptomyces]MQS37046.1 hypothetical protein [Streptomyces katsurahamanus]MQT03111.1 hypothetical protein [Streptomyces jumonjinensis]
MQQVRSRRWADAVGPLDEGAEGQVFDGVAPIAATQVVATVAAAVVVAYAAGAIIGESQPVLE